MTWLKRNPYKKHFVKCKVCGIDIDLRKPEDIFNHHHGAATNKEDLNQQKGSPAYTREAITVYNTSLNRETFHYVLWACWPGYHINTPNDRRGQKAYIAQRVCLN